MTESFSSIGSRLYRSGKFCCALALLGGAASLKADVVYDNINTTTLNSYAGGFPYAEIADDVFLDGTARIFQSIDLAYMFDAPDDVPEGYDSGATVTLTLYKMDGPITPGPNGTASPGTVLFQQTKSIVDTGNTLGYIQNFSDGSGTIILPDHVGVGLMFKGINHSGTDGDGGPVLNDPPVIGGSFPDFFIRDLDEDHPGWDLFEGYDASGEKIPINFGLQINATPDGAAWMNLFSLPLLLVVHRSLRRFRVSRA